MLEIRTALPEFTATVLTEVLRRRPAIERQVTDALDRMPTRLSMSGDAGFETDYCRQVAKELDFMDLFGATVFEQVRGYQLSVAYISLAVVDVRSLQLRPDAQHDPILLRTGTHPKYGRAAERDALRMRGVAVETALAASHRVFLRGEAGSGKTTLLQWLAVSMARRSFSDALAEWNDLVPFFIRLRSYADSHLPSPEEFLDRDITGSLVSEMPEGWVRRLLSQGRAVVMIDGVDEVPKDRRDNVQEWLRRLADEYPRTRYLVTTRSAAAPPDWLDRQNFQTYVIEPMTLPDVRQFILQWHDAVGRSMVDDAARLHLAELATGLTDKVLVSRHLRMLATSPLMCALLCALNRERHMQLPDNRLELFRISLEMFLDRRDIERGLADRALLDFTDKQSFLQDIAYWMMENSKFAADRDLVLNQVELRLRTRRHRVRGTAEEVLEYLLERSGLIREPVMGRIDFVHRSFQEFLAAQAAVLRDSIEGLAERAGDDLWRQVIILAAGLTSTNQSKRLFRTLLDPPRKYRPQQMFFDLTALGCMETAADVAAEHTEEIRRRVGVLMPPRDMDKVIALGAAGDFVIELLAATRLPDKNAILYSAKLAALIGGAGGLQFIEGIARHPDRIHPAVLVSFWDEFDPVEYADRVLTGQNVWSVNMVDPLMIRGIVRQQSVESVAARCGSLWGDFMFLAELSMLRNAEIYIEGNHGVLKVALPPATEKLLISSVLTWERPTNTASADPEAKRQPPAPIGPSGRAYRTLTIRGLNARRVLENLEMSDPVDAVSIQDDRQIADLANVSLPRGVTSLEISMCPLRSLTGIGDYIGSPLRELHIIGLRFRVFDIEPLLRPDPARGGRRLVEQLDVVTLSYVDLSEAEIGDPLADLFPFNFDFRVDVDHQKFMYTTLTATRRK